MKSRGLIFGLLLLSLAGSSFALPPQGRGKKPAKAEKHEKENKPDKKEKEDDRGEKPKQQARISQDRQRQLITEQQQRVVVYRQHLSQQQIGARAYGLQLQQANRLASYRYQQLYLARLRQQEQALQTSHNYNTDPYFYAAPIYFYDRGGIRYETNEAGAQKLRAAINSGYSQGFRAGQADKQDHWTSGYRDSYAYQDANYGYDGYYGDQDSYNYYFREGFSRGYEDGYNKQTQYGNSANGNSTILGSIISTILSLKGLQ